MEIKHVAYFVIGIFLLAMLKGPDINNTSPKERTAEFKVEHLTTLAAQMPKGDEIQNLYGAAQTVLHVRNANDALLKSSQKIGNAESVLDRMHKNVASCKEMDPQANVLANEILQKATQFGKSVAAIERQIRASFDQVGRSVVPMPANKPKKYSPQEDLRTEYELAFTEFNMAFREIGVRISAIEGVINRIGRLAASCNPQKIPPISLAATSTR